MKRHLRYASFVLVCGTLLGAGAQAQVQLFEGVPSLEQLRDALLPPEAEADEPIQTRGIKIGRREVPPKPRSIEASIGEPGMKSPPQAKPVVTNPNYGPGVAFLINFGFDSAALPAGSLPQLDQMASLLRQEKALVLGVEGHTDAVGTPDYNLDLSRRRADAVARYLEQRGVPVAQLVAIGKGKTEPLVGDPYDGKNRRVQFSRISLTKAP